MALRLCLKAIRFKLSKKCRQLERQKWELPKKFPFLHGLNVKRGPLRPSPLHNHPMRVYSFPRWFVYSLRRMALRLCLKAIRLSD